MLHQFNMTSVVGKDDEGHQLRSEITTFIAETGLGPSPQLGIPKKITGTLVASLTPEQLLEFHSKQDVQVGFEGRGYEFSKLEKDGAFELSLIQPHEA
jgi:hypothetical protein